jgi:hypothetical protein
MIFPFHVTPVVEPASAAGLLSSAILYGVSPRQKVESHSVKVSLCYSNAMRNALRRVFVGGADYMNALAVRSGRTSLYRRSITTGWRD